MALLFRFLNPKAIQAMLFLRRFRREADETEDFSGVAIVVGIVSAILEAFRIRSEAGRGKQRTTLRDVLGE